MRVSETTGNYRTTKRWQTGSPQRPNCCCVRVRSGQELVKKVKYAKARKKVHDANKNKELLVWRWLWLGGVPESVSQASLLTLITSGLDRVNCLPVLQLKTFQPPCNEYHQVCTNVQWLYVSTDLTILIARWVKRWHRAQSDNWRGPIRKLEETPAAEVYKTVSGTPPSHRPHRNELPL